MNTPSDNSTALSANAELDIILDLLTEMLVGPITEVLASPEFTEDRVRGLIRDTFRKELGTEVAPRHPRCPSRGAGAGGI